MPDFDRKERMDPTFRQRLGRVMANPPDSQFSFYGELVTYLQAYKFLFVLGFLIKPQKMLQMLSGVYQGKSDCTFCSCLSPF